VYVGFEDGSVQLIEFIQSDSTVNPLYDTRLQNTPVQITIPPWTSPSEAGAALCIGINYDGTRLLSGHSSGKIADWDTGRRSFSAELADLNAPVTSLLMLSPFPVKGLTKPQTVVKPKLGGGNYTFTAQLIGSMGNNVFDRAVSIPGLPSELLEDAILRFSGPVATSSSGDDKLRKENEELWQIINEQRELQKKTWDKYTKLKSGGQ
jgi:pre-rRNA-processing protein IPI3